MKAFQPGQRRLALLVSHSLALVATTAATFASHALHAQQAAATDVAADVTAQASPAISNESKPNDPKPNDRSTNKSTKKETITVRAVPLPGPASEMVQPVTVLDEDALRRKRATSLGDTLAGELGVQSSSFGPAAGRPILRGLDAGRVRVLENGTGTLDVSNLSPDHMVTTESFGARQIEILRGPASLLYGSGAIGGVVNVVSGLIPSEPQNGLGGEAEVRSGTVDHERAGHARLQGGNGEFAWQLSGFTRKTQDYRIPVAPVRGEPSSSGNRLPDSFVDNDGMSLGVAWTRGDAHAGVGVSRIDNDYGLPTGEHTRIRLRQERSEVSSDIPFEAGPVALIKLRAAQADYQHQEIEATGDVATTFKNKGSEGRIEVVHREVAGWKSAAGLQWQERTVSALGEEAYLPETRQRALGIFAVAEKKSGPLTLSGGLRWERENQRPQGALPARDFNAATIALGAGWTFAQGLRLTVNATHAERAAATEELYAFGPHAATGTFDVGDATLGKETSRNLDLALQQDLGSTRWKVGVFANRIRDYIFARSVDANGDGVADRVNAAGEVEADGELLLQRTSHADARFAGVEAEWVWAPDRPVGGRTVDGPSLRLFADSVRGKLASGGNLPRMSPARLGVEAGWTEGRWSLQGTVLRVARQSRVAELETATAGYTRVDGELSYRLPPATTTGEWTFYLQGRNLTDKEIRVHTSYLKELAPQPGRGFVLGVRSTF